MPLSRAIGTLRHAVIVNIASAISIAGVCALAFATGILSSEDELVESATLFATDWVATALDNREEVVRTLADRAVLTDATYFRSIAGVGHVYRYEILRIDGSVLLDSLRFSSASEPSSARAELISEGVTLLRGGAGTPGDPLTGVVVELPVKDGANLVGTARVYTDQSSAEVIFAREAVSAVVIIAALALLGLGNCIAVGVLQDRQRRSHARIHHLAHHDPLTGIANRNVFQHELTRSVDGRRCRDGHVALHLIDLDKFKAINDSLGHHGGDELLRCIATGLAEALRPDDVVARVGGDEFAVIQRGVTSHHQAATLAERMLGMARQIRELHGVPVNPTLSIGIAFAPEHGTDPDELRRAADAALYRAKALGRNQFVVFEAGMDEHLRRRNRLRVMVREALDRNTLVLHYQPLHANDGSLLGFEALLRLPDGHGGFIAPGEVIPVVEEMGLTPELGAWVLGEACRTASNWQDDVAIAVNLSVQQFRHDLCAVVAHALADSGLAPNRLELEVTESMFIDDPERVDATLRQLKELGVRIVMDDFGTGYSSLSTIWQFPFDKLKVDRSCFKALGTSDRVGQVLKLIAMMSNAMDIGLVAEGIETETQRDFACAAGYDELQGFLYGRPMPSADVGTYIADAGAPKSSHPAEPGFLVQPAVTRLAS